MDEFKGTPLLQTLFTNGKTVCVQGGVLIISPVENKKALGKWLAKNRLALINEIAFLLSIDLYVYDSYTKGFYGKKYSAGITLQFTNVNTMALSHVIYNADLKRVRDSKNGKAGELLPGKQFSPPKRGAFIKFWKSIGLVFPPRRGSFYRYMGNLKQFIFVPEVDSANKITNKQIATLSISYDDLAYLYNQQSADNSRTRCIQSADNLNTRVAYKRVGSAYEAKGLEKNMATSEIYCDKSLYGSAGIRENLPSKAVKVNPRNQTYEEWWCDYDEA